MVNYSTISDKPIVLIHGQDVQRFYGNALATMQDGFNPRKVIMVCQGIQKKHKGKSFCFASDLDVIAADILREISERG